MGDTSARFVVMAGNIGAGKTSLAEGLASRWGWTVGHEAVSRNAYLSDYYLEPARWAFHLAVHNLELRLRQHTELKRKGENVILDRSIYEDRHVFVEVQRELGLLSHRDYRCYVALWKMCIDKVPIPDILIYLHAPTNVLLKRIRKRGRDMEQRIDLEYLALLEEKYIKWIKNFTDCPIITIDSSVSEKVILNEKFPHQAALDSL